MMHSNVFRGYRKTSGMKLVDDVFRGIAKQAVFLSSHENKTALSQFYYKKYF